MVVKTDCSLRAHLASRKILALLVSCGLAAQVGQVAAEAVCTPEHIARMIQNEVPDDVIREVCADAGVDVDAVAPAAVVPAEEVREERQHDRARVQSGRDGGPRRTFFGVGLYNLRSTAYYYRGGEYTDDYIGLNLFLRQAFQRRLSGDFGYYLSRHTDYSDSRISGFDSVLWWSTNALNPGWNFGVGIGFYTESGGWGQGNIYGYQFGLLVGYRGNKSGFDLQLKGRGTSDQESERSVVDVSHSTYSFNYVYQF
ncbi:hypothetical protein [Halorhodospira abdelmalekii]|uniref:hypothetical protein n=1 Tax=Halorhodospira abdelmalekii TaxID=421629 RepID=UPI00190734E3|nr:hypothetical protein [Halorhodospira abdelmalekii]